MTDEQKRRKLENLEQFLFRAETSTAADAGTFAGLSVDDARQLAENLRRQLAGEPAQKKAYHVNRRKIEA